MKKIYMTLFMSGLLAACSSIDVSKQSSITIPQQFEHTQNALGDQNIQEWWTFWKDPQLTQLIQKGLKNNLDIALAQSRLKEALANSQYTQADKGITLAANASAMTGHSAIDLPHWGTETGHLQMANGGIVASWEPDFFGKKKSDTDAAHYAALSQEEQLYATQLAIVSQIADEYFQMNALWKQHQILTQNIKTLQSLHHYVSNRFKAGQTTQYEVDEVKTKILGLQSQQSILLAQVDNIKRTIAVILGEIPSNIIVQPNPQVLAYTPSLPSGQVPSRVMERRPDIKAHALAVKARAAQVASAKADLFPRFDIQFLGQGGRVALDKDLASIGGVGGIISVGVQLPIFTNGRIQANIDAADARLKTSIIKYDQALLKALAEVESTYQTQTALNKKVEWLQQTNRQQHHQTYQVSQLFQHGYKTLDDILTAQLNTWDSQSKLTEAQLQRHQNMIRLYKSLGGGW